MSVKADEVALRRAVLRNGKSSPLRLVSLGRVHTSTCDDYPLPVVAWSLMHHRRLYRVLEKWTDRGWWEYGVSPRTGWLTRAGIAAFAQEIVGS